MRTTRISSDQRAALSKAFADGLQQDVPLAPYTSARVGGPADHLIVVRSADALESATGRLWELGIPFRVLGGGSNVLVSDLGVREVVILNEARAVRFEARDSGPLVRAESGAAFGAVARRSADRGLAGLEWAAGVPGTVGGAVVGNAGAHGGDVAGSVEVAEILQPSGRRESWSAARLDYAYRDSWLKRHPGEAVVLAASFRLTKSTRDRVRATMAEFVAYRRRTQPGGASMGSMFKNPSGDSAGRLIEGAGLKGFRCGAAQISELHANFFINHGGATASDVWGLIQIAGERVEEQFGVRLELEVELFGDWEPILQETAPRCGGRT